LGRWGRRREERGELFLSPRISNAQRSLHLRKPAERLLLPASSSFFLLFFLQTHITQPKRDGTRKETTVCVFGFETPSTGPGVVVVVWVCLFFWGGVVFDVLFAAPRATAAIRVFFFFVFFRQFAPVRQSREKHKPNRDCETRDFTGERSAGKGFVGFLLLLLLLLRRRPGLAIEQCGGLSSLLRHWDRDF
jgi:hypothetical protein